MAADGRPITPGYASPEQFLGQPVTTATDVYSLGAILYELLSGAKAHQVSSSSPEAWRRAVCETEPARPSDAVPPDLPGAVRLRRRLSGDLDNIVGMAMHKQPERRYASVDELAADLRRYLAGEPAAARRDSLAYRAGKFARRHALWLAAALLVAASMLVGTALAVIQARRADAARRVADDRLTQMVALANHSLFDIHARLGRAGKLFDPRVDVEQGVIGQRHHLREPVVGHAAGGIGAPGLNHRQRGPHQHTGGHQQCRRQPQRVAARELSGAIGQRIAARGHRLAGQVAAQIRGQLVHRSVAALRLLVHGHPHDVVEVARKPAAKAHGARQIRRDGVAGPRRFGLAHRAPPRFGR